MTGYIQAEILGKTRGLKFGNLAAEQITMELIALGVATQGNYSSAMISVIIYWGLYNNSFVKRQELDVTFEDICNWMDDNWKNKDVEPMITSIVKTYEESRQTKDVIQDLTEKVEDIKKKYLIPGNE
jgi:hypothetical protein